MSHRLDDAAVVSALLQQWGAPASVLTRLQATGFTTLGLLGHALPSPDAEDSFLCTVLDLDPADAVQLHCRLSAPTASTCTGPLPISVYNRSCCRGQPDSDCTIAQAHAVRSAGHAPEILGQLPVHPRAHAGTRVPVRPAACLCYWGVAVVALALSLH